MRRLLDYTTWAGCLTAALVTLGVPLVAAIGPPSLAAGALGSRDAADWRNDPVFAQAFRGRGLLVTVAGVGNVQLRTRRPVLMEVSSLNQLPYVPESGPAMQRILQRVYGVDLLTPPPDDRRRPGLAPETPRRLWEARTAEQWSALGDEFGFTEILTYRNWNLQLPVAARSQRLMLYRVPPTKPLSKSTKLSVAGFARIQPDAAKPELLQVQLPPN